jgi:methionyl-tRNA synthetase
MTEENTTHSNEGELQIQKKHIGIEDFAKVELKVGKILEFHLIEGADKLYRFLVDVGETEVVKNEAGEIVETKPSYRTILSGIREYFPDGNIFVGKFVCVVANLAPRKMRGFESNGMLLFAGGGSVAVPGNLFMVSPLENGLSELKPGTVIR